MDMGTLRPACDVRAGSAISQGPALLSEDAAIRVGRRHCQGGGACQRCGQRL